MKRLLRALALVLLSAALAASQTAVVERNVNLRPDPSTNNTPIEKLTPPTQIQLLEPNPTNGFLHIQADSQSGWVWAKNVQVQPTSAGTGGGAPTGNPPTGNVPAMAVSSDWERPSPQDNVFQSDEGECAETGDGGDTDTNKRKNRIDVPAAYHPVTWDAINSLAFPQGAKTSRMDWTPDQLAQIQPVEGVALSVEGFLYKVKVESSSRNATSGGESTNCHAHLAIDVDWHMPLTANDGEGQDVAIIVETTPRVRQAHPNWTTARLKPWTAHLGNQPNSSYNHARVRISGWLMLDPEHQDMINEGLRSTLWEIHPITRIEVLESGRWVDLDSQP